jgi:membrane protein implicated in regulation of membrane protease activity
VVPVAPTPVSDVAATVVIPSAATPLAPASAQPTTITDAEVPLASAITAHWALLNLILAVISVLIAVILAVGYFSRRKGEKVENEWTTEDTRGSRGIAWRTLAVIFGVIAPVVFIITEDITLPMALVDTFTLLMALFVVIQIASAIVVHQVRKARGGNDDDTTESPAY